MKRLGINILALLVCVLWALNSQGVGDTDTDSTAEGPAGHKPRGASRFEISPPLRDQIAKEL
ncbi:MAG: hypothetical protein ACKN9V_05065, partial [Pseudomonadota bacterium]